MENPKIAIEAIVDGEKRIGDLKVYPISIGRYALLELVESPFVAKDKDFTLYNLVPTFYIMCNPKENLKGYTRKNIENLVEKSLEWAEDFDTSIVSKLIDDVAEALGLLKKVQPQAPEKNGESKKDSAQTVG